MELPTTDTKDNDKMAAFRPTFLKDNKLAEIIREPISA